MNRTLLYFEVRGLPLALRVEDLSGVHEPGPIHPLPGTAPLVAGISTVAGQVVTVLDLAAVLAAEGAAAPSPAAAALPPLVIILSGRWQGLALLLASALQFGALDGPSPPPPGAVGRLCREASRAPDGRLAGILHLPRLARLLTPVHPQPPGA
ncbi:MAG: chemotaxis protein CheW [Acidobacteriota bacterium]